MRTFLFGVLCAFLYTMASAASAQTPDGKTPAVEMACDKYVGEGARHGLCVAYCEAQDCDLVKPGTDPSCDRISERFVDWSVKKGFLKGKPKPESPVIDCFTSLCTEEDRTFCKGVERDCLVDGVCQEVCTSEFQGFDPHGNPVCSQVPCKKCVKEEG